MSASDDQVAVRFSLHNLRRPDACWKVGQRTVPPQTGLISRAFRNEFCLIAGGETGGYTEDP